MSQGRKIVEMKIPSLAKAFGVISGFLIAVMILLMTAEVLMRYFLKAPIEWEVDVTGFLMVASVFFGGAYTLLTEGHVRVDILIEKLSSEKKATCLLFGYVLTLLFVVFMSYYATLDFIKAYRLSEMTSGTEPLPFYPVKLTIVIGSYLLCLALISEIVQCYFDRKKESPKI